MKSTFKALVPAIAFGIAAAIPMVRAADEPKSRPAPEAGAAKKGGDRPDGERPGGGRRGPDAKALAERLNLTPEQTAKVEAIFKKGEAAMAAARESQDREKMREVRTGMNAEIKAVLTGDQIAQFEEMMSRGRPGEGKEGKEGKAGGERTKKQP